MCPDTRKATETASGSIPCALYSCPFRHDRVVQETLQDALNDYMINPNKMRVKEDELEKEIRKLEEKLKDREEALPADSIQLQQRLWIEGLDTMIEDKKNELAELKREKP